jgi:NAD(P)H dehydrogenase (quinone)
MSDVIAVTGSTGAVGGEVALLLAEQGVPQRLLARSPEKAPVYADAVAVACSYGGPEAVAALNGVTVLLMVSASESADRLDQHRAFIDSAVAAGVGHIVYTSFFGAAPDCTFTLGRDHFATEEHIKGSGLGFTFLRDNFYLDFLPALVGEDGVIRGPAGSGRVAAVAREDIARSAVAVLRDPAAHVDATYDLTGSEAVSLAEVAVILTEVTGKPVEYHDETIEEAYESRKKWVAPDWQMDAWVSTYTAIANGEMEGTSDSVERLTGRPPLRLRDLLSR